MDQQAITSKPLRLEWLDLAKVIGIYLMIVGHQNSLNQQLVQWIFSFHMPLFFFLSGITFSHKPQGVALGKIFRSLIVPFLILSCFWCFFYLICYFNNGIPIQSIYPYIIGTFLSPGKEFFSFHPLCIYLWFLLALAFIKAVSTLIKSNKIMVVVGILSFIVAQLLKKFGIILPLAIDSALLAYPFFIMGYLLKKFIVKKHSYGIVVLVLFLSAFVTTWLGINNGVVDVNKNLSGDNPFLFLACGLSGSLMIIALSCLITSKLKFWGGVQILSKGAILMVGTSAPLTSIYRDIFHQVFPMFAVDGNAFCLVLGFIVLISYYPLTLLCEKYFPAIIGYRKK